MALIKCPECGKEISDKTDRCIYCGFPIKDGKFGIHIVKCPECGSEVEETAAICPKCGYPIDEESIKNSGKKKKAVIAAVIFLVFVIIVSTVAILWVKSTKTDDSPETQETNDTADDSPETQETNDTTDESTATQEMYDETVNTIDILASVLGTTGNANLTISVPNEVLELMDNTNIFGFQGQVQYHATSDSVDSDGNHIVNKMDWVSSEPYSAENMQTLLNHLREIYGQYGWGNISVEGEISHAYEWADVDGYTYILLGQTPENKMTILWIR